MSLHRETGLSGEKTRRSRKSVIFGSFFRGDILPLRQEYCRTPEKRNSLARLSPTFSSAANPLSVIINPFDSLPRIFFSSLAFASIVPRIDDRKRNDWENGRREEMRKKLSARNLNIAAHQGYISKRKPYAHVYTRCWERVYEFTNSMCIYVCMVARERKEILINGIRTRIHDVPRCRGNIASLVCLLGWFSDLSKYLSYVYKFLSSFNAIYVKFSILNCEKQRQTKSMLLTMENVKSKLSNSFYIYPFDSVFQSNKT